MGSGNKTKDPSEYLEPAGHRPCQRCNDEGDGGLCTCCGYLHTATVVGQCLQCGGPQLPGSEYCSIHPAEKGTWAWGMATWLNEPHVRPLEDWQWRAKEYPR